MNYVQKRLKEINKLLVASRRLNRAVNRLVEACNEARRAKKKP